MSEITITIPGLVYVGSTYTDERDGEIRHFTFDGDAYERTVRNLETTHYVRGGIGYQSTDDLGVAVQGLLVDRTMMPKDRARLAVAALRGWVMHNDGEHEPLTWFRLMADTRLEVVA